MSENDAYEQAFRNGYEAREKEIIRCKDCVFLNKKGFCFSHEEMMIGNEYCSMAIARKETK